MSMKNNSKDPRERLGYDDDSTFYDREYHGRCGYDEDYDEDLRDDYDDYDDDPDWENDYDY